METTSGNVSDFEPTNNSQCKFNEPYNDVRFTMIIGACGLAITGIFSNLLLMFVFLKLSNIFNRMERCKSNRLYVICLAFMDSSVCCFYVFLMGLDAIAIYFQSQTAYDVYNDHVLFMFIAFRMIQIAIPYFIIVAALERWLFVSGFHRRRPLRGLTTPRTRFTVVAIILLLCFVLRVPMMFAYKMEYKAECPDPLERRGVGPRPFAESAFFQIVNFYALAFLYIFAPFLILIWLNVATIYALKRSDKKFSEGNMQIELKDTFNTTTGIGYSLVEKTGTPTVEDTTLAEANTANNNLTLTPMGMETPTHSMVSRGGAVELLYGSCASLPIDNNNVASGSIGGSPKWTTIVWDRQRRPTGGTITEESRRIHARKRRVREMTTTVVAVVLSYLACTAPNFALTVLETFFPDAIYVVGETSRDFYIVCADLTSFLSMFSSCLRILINAAYSHEVRRQIADVLKLPSTWWRKPA